MRMVVVITAVALGLSALRVTAADAAPGRKGTGGAGQHERVPPSVRCDKNGDGVLSRDEWPFSPELFTRLDKNGNGAIDADERPGKRGKHGKGGEGKGKGGLGKDGHGKS
jgi:hypothetical protein